MKNIVAYTPNEHPYPPYLSINETPDGDITITVRTSADNKGNCGTVSTITIPGSEFRWQILGKLMAGVFKDEDGN